MAPAAIGMDPLPPLTPQDRAAALRDRFEPLGPGLTDAVNRAATGHVLNHSQEPVRDRRADFRQAA